MIGPSDIQIILGKVRPLSRPHTEAHPQVLIIALLSLMHFPLNQCSSKLVKVWRVFQQIINNLHISRFNG